MAFTLIVCLAAAYLVSTALAGPSLVAAIVASLAGACLVVAHHAGQARRGR